MSEGWRREPEREAAIGKILDAAEKAFVELGVSAASMAKIADYAGCSRGTLYRYFENRHQLHLAYIHRAARQTVLRVARRIEGIRDPRERLVSGILVAVSEVRGNPATAAWFTPGIAGMAARMSRSSELIEALMTRFVADLLPRVEVDQVEGSKLRARWLVRVVVSLLSMPGEDLAEERALVDRFVAPVLSETP